MSVEIEHMSHNRPGWHADAKWIVGIIVFFFMAGTLVVGSLVRLTERETAIPVMTVVVASMVSPLGLDDASGLADARQAIARAPGKSIKPFPGIDAEISAADLDAKSPRQIRLDLFRHVVEPIYDGGQLTSSSTTTADAPTMASAGILVFASQSAHDQLYQVLRPLLILDVLLLVLLTLFSIGFGRLASLGWVFVLVSAPPLGIVTFLGMAMRTHPVTPSTGQEISLASQAGQIAGEVAPLIIKPLQTLYLPLAEVGLGLIVLATIGGIIRSLIIGRQKSAG